jgi:hypothetical protein
MKERVCRELYGQRAKYPLGARDINRNDFDYIRDEFKRQKDSAHQFLLLTADYFDRMSSGSIKEEIEQSHYLSGIYNLGAIIHPLSAIKFYLYVFSTRSSEKLWFGEILNHRMPFKKRRIDFRIGQSPEFGELEPFMHEYLRSIDLSLNDEKKKDYISDDYRIFACDTSQLGDRANIDYYKPEYIELETKYAHENTAKLGDIAEIIFPRELIESDGLFTIKLSDASYPLRPTALVPLRDSARTAPVKRNDIVTNQFLNSAFLNLTARPDLVIANTQLIIRLKDKRFNNAYVTIYLNSARMRVYFERRKRGATIPRLAREDLLNFEIVVPSERANRAAKDFLASLGEISEGSERIKAIDKLLFVKNPLLGKPLQNELLAELHDKLQATKNAQIRELFELDLHEIEKCYKSGAYKACLVLCGSLLEALVLDWLSEIEQHDYFKDADVTNLENLINKLRSAERLTQHEAHLAHDIRKKRNLIHPKNYIANTPLEKQVCEAVMNDLKPLIVRRYTGVEE